MSSLPLPQIPAGRPGANPPDPERYDPTAIRDYAIPDLIEIFLYVRQDLAARRELVRDAEQAFDEIQPVLVARMIDQYGYGCVYAQGMQLRAHRDRRSMDVRPTPRSGGSYRVRP